VAEHDRVCALRQLGIGSHGLAAQLSGERGCLQARGDDEDFDGEVDETKPAEEVAELEPDAIREAYVQAEDEQLEDEDFDESDEDSDDDESDEDESDEDEIDLDADDEDDDIDDDIEVINGDTDESDDDESDDDEYDADDSDEDDSEDDDDSDEDDSDEQPAPVTAVGGRHRRRAAVRPAGPPAHDG